MTIYTILKRNTGEVLNMTFRSKFEAFEYLVLNHGLTWDRRYRILGAIKVEDSQ